MLLTAANRWFRDNNPLFETREFLKSLGKYIKD